MTLINTHLMPAPSSVPLLATAQQYIADMSASSPQNGQNNIISTTSSHHATIYMFEVAKVVEDSVPLEEIENRLGVCNAFPMVVRDVVQAPNAVMLTFTTPQAVWRLHKLVVETLSPLRNKDAECPGWVFKTPTKGLRLSAFSLHGDPNAGHMFSSMMHVTLLCDRLLPADALAKLRHMLIGQEIEFQGPHVRMADANGRLM